MTRWEDPLPFKSTGSLDYLIQRFEAAADDETSPLRTIARDVLQDLQRVPELRGDLDDPDLFVREKDLIARMMAAVFPPASAQVGAAGVPFVFQTIFETEESRALGIMRPETLLQSSCISPELLGVGKTLSAYQLILERIYNVPTNFEFPLIVSLPTEDGLQRHLQMEWSPEFMSIELRGPKPDLSDDEIGAILRDPYDTEFVESLLPPSRFEFRGFSAVTTTDVTHSEVVSRLKDDLIERGALATSERIDLLQGRIRNLTRVPDAVLGLIGIERSDEPGAMTRVQALGRSLLEEGGCLPSCSQGQHSCYGSAAAPEARPVIIADLQKEEIKSGLDARLQEKGIRSVVLCPLRVGDRLVGILEVGSPTPGAFSAFTGLLVDDVAPLFTTAVSRALDEREDRIEAAIKKNYTAIHPSVEWRFREAAAEILEGADSPPDVVFENVFPLYGLADIRGSSDRRNQVIREDLRTQLELALAAVQAGALSRPMTVLDEIAFRIRQHMERLDTSLRSEDERMSLDFLSRDVEPLLDRISGFSPAAADRVNVYRDAVDPRFGVVYDRRRAFEESVAGINNLIARVLGREEETAQRTVPHLFESFKTDGVDYNVYAGASLLSDGDFDPLYLRDLRLWQLKLHAHIDWEAHHCDNASREAVDLTHLVLVQDHPLSIRFRIDEKRFDVDGAYNIRYEIMKKRIDKARVRGTRERLTQPGHLAVVFTQASEGAEYRRYLDFLMAAGYFVGPIEELELEDMQGVFGLRAFRVAFAPRPDGLGLLAEPGDAVPEGMKDRVTTPTPSGDL